jgi:hypothetical protein
MLFNEVVGAPKATEVIKFLLRKFVEEYVFSVGSLLEWIPQTEDARSQHVTCKHQLWLLVAGVLKPEEVKAVNKGWMVRHLLPHVCEFDNSSTSPQTTQRRRNWELARTAEDFPSITLGITSPSFFHTLVLAHLKPSGEQRCSSSSLFQLVDQPELFHNDAPTAQLLSTMAKQWKPKGFTSGFLPLRR